MTKFCVRTMLITAAVTLTLAVSGLSLMRTPDQLEAPYVAIAGDDTFRLPDCPSVQNLTSESLVKFKTVEEALAADMKPCPYCFSETSRLAQPPSP